MTRHTAALLACLLVTTTAFAQQTQTVGMHAPPAPGKVVIDGKLDDWDLSGSRLMTYDVATMKDRLSGTVAFMWDENYYYASIRWRDPNPMVNGFDPLVDYGNSWRGDCVQLRIKTDRIAHVTAWYHAGTKRPGMTIHWGPFKPKDHPDYGGLNDAMSAGAKQAFVMDKDGKGYTQEIAVPWKLLTREGNSLKAGDTMLSGVELLYGKATGIDFPDHRYADNVSPKAKAGAMFFWVGDEAWGTLTLEKEGNLKLPPQTFKGEVVAEPQGPIFIEYQVEKQGYVSLVINNDKGVRVRNLLKEVFKEKGAHKAKWDGADDHGNAVPVGNYQFKAIVRDDLHVNYATHFNNPGTPPWDNLKLDGNWTSDHIESYVLTTDGDQIYVGSPVVEAGWAPIALDMDFNKVWGRKLDGAALAAEGGVLYVLYDRGSPKKGDTVAVHVDRVDAKTGNYLPFDNQDLPMGGVRLPVTEYVTQEDNNPHHGFDAGRLNVQGAAVRGKVLAISLQLEDRIALYDSKTGKSLGDIKLSSPAGLAFNVAGELLAVSGGQVVKVDVATKQVAPFVTEHVDVPKRLAVASDGRIAVGNWGTLQNVAVFAADGSYLSSVGIPGGRKIRGAYDKLGFARPMGLAFDNSDRLWVAEYFAAPRRISRWELDGTYLDERVGPAYYSGGGLVDPEESTRIYYGDVEFSVDYAKPGASRVERIVSGHLGDRAIPMHMGVGTGDHIIRHQKGSYHVHARRGKNLVMKKQPDGAFLPSAAFAWDHHIIPGEDIPAGQRYQWADRNGDGLVQKAEMAIVDLPPGVEREVCAAYWGDGVGPDLTVYTVIRQYRGNRAGAHQLWKFPVKEWTECGAPVYDVANPVVLVQELPVKNVTSIAALKDGSLVLNSAPDFLCLDSAGNTKWTYPNTDQNPYVAGALRSGVFIGPQKFTGIGDYGAAIGEVLMVSGYNGSRFLITADGIWLGHVFNDCRNGPESLPNTITPGFNMDNISCGGESFSGAFTRTRDGKSLMMTGGTCALATEITGIESIKRFEGAFTVDQTLADKASEYRAKELDKKNKAAQDNVLRIASSTAPRIDGDLADWEADKAVQWDAGAKRIIKAKVRRDAENIYFAYEVPDTTPMINNGPDYQLLFESGDCVDFWLRTDFKNETKSPIKGDIRLMFSVYKGKPVAVLMEQKAAQKKNPFDFRSPARSFTFDRVEMLTGAKVVFKRSLMGYTFEASVPVKEIGHTLPRGTTIGDVGVIFSDVDGNESLQRSCWSNKATNITDDIPDEAMLAPDKWGKVVVE